MNITFNWLKEYVDFSGTPEDLAGRLASLGLKVRGAKKVREFDGIVVAQVVSRDKHPNADRLSLCRVHDGVSERQIVCGAQNFQAGDKVALILPGSSLPLKPGETKPFVIKVGKIRGAESHGMMCSPQELGLPDAVDGILILRPDAQVGQPFADYLGRAGDTVYDLDIPPDQTELHSVIGIARKLAAVSGNAFKLPQAASGPGESSGTNIDSFLAVRIDEPQLCPRYIARLVLGVKIGPSPGWLRETLEKVGIRSINNVVDVTHYVLLETGQPVHAFDYRQFQSRTGVPRVPPVPQTSIGVPPLQPQDVPDVAAAQDRWDACPTLIVRRAAEGEKFTAADNRERTLTGDMLLLADSSGAIALAGVTGGRDTAIRDTTSDVVIECARFQSANISFTTRTLGLRTESSGRFERGTDAGSLEWANRRAAQLLLETAGGRLVPGVIDAHAS